MARALTTARRTAAALALALGTALALSACGEGELPIDTPSLPDLEDSLSSLAPDFPADVASDLQELAPDLSAAEIVSGAQELCQSAADGADEEQLARDAASLFGVEEAEGPTIVETVQPYCDVIG
ncbi:hypothetical protein GCM10009853_017950 [Glycomyces scopariae]|uniref:DUF732 domain-containing protein n=1 Tax=Glycomyces sambucus TaxID=380244 RepID=A0A1G9HVM0_9ACTN|nr:hypothetical protein [Glycomyces sambucus]SDL17018.1 hypothetical protein SAMN05216298_2863 [Glycomyces sambucus]